MPWWAWVLAAPAILFGLVCAAFGLLGALTAPSVSRAVTINGLERIVQIHYYHWLPRLLRVWGLSMYPHVYLKGHLWPQGTPWDGKTKTVQRWQVAHELAHCAQALRWGWFVYRCRAFGEPLIWWRHNARPMEREANAYQRGITLGTDPDVSAPWLADYVNAGMPA
ncbi:MAG TPA: hypothetical protein VJP78_15505 [Thermoleophilia bacterium]|nr:hypothetical protein [Thermoleophilia bacterium]